MHKHNTTCFVVFIPHCWSHNGSFYTNIAAKQLFLPHFGYLSKKMNLFPTKNLVFHCKTGLNVFLHIVEVNLQHTVLEMPAKWIIWRFQKKLELKTTHFQLQGVEGARTSQCVSVAKEFFLGERDSLNGFIMSQKWYLAHSLALSASCARVGQHQKNPMFELNRGEKPTAR